MPENVWDFPRPPALVPCERRAQVVLGGVVVADSERALRVLETSHPPTVYLPFADCEMSAFTRAEGGSFCEWKGQASYLDVAAGGRTARAAAWWYPDPSPPYEALREHFSVYPGRVDRCLLGEEEVLPQPGGFYGGWVTSDLVGPFKGGPGTSGW